MTQDQRDNDLDGADGTRDWTPEEEAGLLEMRERTTPFEVTERHAIGLTLAEVDEAVGFDPDEVEAAADEIRAELDAVEDIAIAERIRDRDATDTGARTSLADAAEEFGIDLDAYDRDPIDQPDEWGDLATWRTAAATRDEDTAP